MAEVLLVEGFENKNQDCVGGCGRARGKGFEESERGEGKASEGQGGLLFLPLVASDLTVRRNLVGRASEFGKRRMHAEGNPL